MKKIVIYLVAMLAFATAASAQGWFRQPTPNDTLRSTVILPDNSVVFQIYAPHAQSVAVMGDLPWDKPVKFVKETNGVWKGRLAGIVDGVYRYRFLVDGLTVYDPKAPSASETSALLTVAPKGDEFFAMKNVPHGAVAERYYWSQTLGTVRRMHVWTPAGYETSKKKLPVLYLVHGGGDTDNSWPGVGAAGLILDNLMAEGKMEPMVVVMPNGSIEMPDGKFWEPRDAGKSMFGEEVTLKWALAHSNNRISTYLMKRFGPEAVIEMARRMGVTSDIPAVPSICLGVCDISLYEMVGAMNTFANQGVYIKPMFITKIEDKNGNVIEYFDTEEVEAMDKVTAYKMIELMKGVVQSGTGVRLKYKYGLRNPIAGKTGTTQNQSDGWFMGITPDLTTGIWTGAEDRAVHFRTIGLGQGSNMALPVWAIYMQKVYADSTLDISRGDFPKPLSDVALEFDCELYEQEQSQKNQVVAEEEEF